LTFFNCSTVAAVFVATFVYDLPILRGNSGTPLLRATLGGWEVSGIVTTETGMPLNITLGGSQGSNGLANERTART